MTKKILFFALCLACFMGVSRAQTAVPMPFVKAQFFNTNGTPCAGCLLSTFSAGTSTPLATFTDSGAGTPNANPVVLDSAGRADIFLSAASYKFVLKTPLSVQIWSEDNISAANLATVLNTLTVNGNLTQGQPTAATAGANQSSFLDCMNATYWTGAASAIDKWCFQDVLGAGANPTSTFTLTHSGSGGTPALSLPSVIFNNPTFTGTANAVNIVALGTLSAGATTLGNTTTGTLGAGATSVTSMVNTGDETLSTGKVIKWNSDTSISRDTVPGTIDIGTGTQGSIVGTVKAASFISNQAGTITSSGFQATSATLPFVAWNITTGLADTHWWDCGIQSAVTFRCAAVNDAGNNPHNWVTVSTSGANVIGPITFGAGGGVQTVPQVTDTFAMLGTAQTFTAVQHLSANRVAVTTDFTTANNTSLQAITGLSWTFPATAANYSFHCGLLYSQATANTGVNFGIQAATNNPTNITALGVMELTIGPPSTFVASGLATLSTTVATAIVGSTPGALGTNYTMMIDGTLELAASANTVNIMVSTAAGADAVTVKRGSSCILF